MDLSRRTMDLREHVARLRLRRTASGNQHSKGGSTTKLPFFFNGSFSIHSLVCLGGFTSVLDLLLCEPRDIAKRSKLGLSEISAIIRKVCQESVAPVPLLQQQLNEAESIFTTGDPGLDDVLGGGIRTGMVWECAGERCDASLYIWLDLLLSAGWSFAVPRANLNWLCNCPCPCNCLKVKAVSLALRVT